MDEKLKKTINKESIIPEMEISTKGSIANKNEDEVDTEIESLEESQLPSSDENELEDIDETLQKLTKNELKNRIIESIKIYKSKYGSVPKQITNLVAHEFNQNISKKLEDITNKLTDVYKKLNKDASIKFEKSISDPLRYDYTPSSTAPNKNICSILSDDFVLKFVKQLSPERKALYYSYLNDNDDVNAWNILEPRIIDNIRANWFPIDIKPYITEISNEVTKDLLKTI